MGRRFGRGRCRLLKLLLLPVLLAFCRPYGFSAVVVAQTGVTLGIGQLDDARFPAVSAAVSVSDARGLPITGLARDRWEVLEDGQPVTSFEVTPAADSALPLSVVLAIDPSERLAGAPLDAAKAASIEFVRGLGPNDQVALVLFSRQDQVVQPFTRDVALLTRQIEAVEAAGNTALYDSVGVALERAAMGAGRKTVILLTDGRESGSRRKLEDIGPLLAARGATLFAIGLGGAPDRAELGRLAQQSGGVALFAPAAADLRVAFQRITEQLRNQYVVRFRSAQPSNSAPHELTIRARTDSGAASATSRFSARQVPPVIEILSPTPRAEISGQQRIEVRITAAAPIAVVAVLTGDRAVVTERLDSQRAAEQFQGTLTLNTTTLATGDANLLIAATDSLGNVGTRDLPVRIVRAAPVVASPTTAATPTVVPTTVPVTIPAQTQTGTVSEEAGEGEWTVLQTILYAIGGIAFLVIWTIEIAWLYRRGRRRQKQWCFRHHKSVGPGGLCPHCELEAQRRILVRLGEVSGRRSTEVPATTSSSAEEVSSSGEPKDRG
ncbi:MAG: VWA domain-containing protein [Chloroflexi bacterium]|nr:VWA domain-containing protein [Chloroflexota bacterium]